MISQQNAERGGKKKMTVEDVNIKIAKMRSLRLDLLMMMDEEQLDQRTETVFETVAKYLENSMDELSKLQVIMPDVRSE